MPNNAGIRQSETPLRVGIIGLGRVAWELETDPLRSKPCSHAGAWKNATGVELVAGCDIDPEQRTAFTAHFPEAVLYEDFREMLAKERIDLLSICAYATDRKEMVLAAVHSGVRGIWCEKAIAASLEEADIMAAELSDNGVPMIVSFMRRWNRRYEQIKGIMEEGAIGAVESINVHFSGNMLHTGTHAFDVLHHWCGEVETVQAWLDTETGRGEQSGYRFDGDNCVSDFGGFAVLRFRNGIEAVIHGHEKEYFRFEFEILGDQGMIRIGNSQLELWQAAESNRYSGFKELSRAEFPSIEEQNPWTAAASDLIYAIAARRAPRCGVDEGRHALAVALAMHHSHHLGNLPVRLEQAPATLYVPSR